MTERTFVGVDWAAGAWLAVGYSDVGFTDATCFADIETLWNNYAETAERIVVDVPIGLCESRHRDDHCCVDTDGELSRVCDDLARPLIGSRSSLVFTAPAREPARMAASGEPYAAVNARNKELTGKGLMQQAANIADGIVAVEDLLLAGPGDPNVLVEGHPEVCFRAFNGSPLRYSKMTAAGVAERLHALEAVPEYDPGVWRTVAEALGASGASVGIDDVLDALVLALTARAAPAEYRTIPTDPPTDRKGLPMQMVYRAAEPLVAKETS